MKNKDIVNQRYSAENKINYDIVGVSTSIITKDLISYAKNCSFQGTGAYLAELLSDGAFEDYEKVYAAISNDRIIGFVAIVKESCAENNGNEPWLDFLFVDEKYRNQYIGLAFINKICHYAKSIGFEFLYLCTLSHVDYYKRAGFKILYTTDYYNGAGFEEKISVMKKRLGAENDR